MWAHESTFYFSYTQTRRRDEQLRKWKARACAVCVTLYVCKCWAHKYSIPKGATAIANATTCTQYTIHTLCERRAFMILLFCHFIRTFAIQCWSAGCHFILFPNSKYQCISHRYACVYWVFIWQYCVYIRPVVDKRWWKENNTRQRKERKKKKTHSRKILPRGKKLHTHQFSVHITFNTLALLMFEGSNTASDNENYLNNVKRPCFPKHTRWNLFDYDIIFIFLWFCLTHKVKKKLSNSLESSKTTRRRQAKRDIEKGNDFKEKIQRKKKKNETINCVKNESKKDTSIL